MKKQDYLLFAIIIIAFIIWMYIVQKYFTVSYDELPIEEKIRYEQFMLPWKESERMKQEELDLNDNEIRNKAIDEFVIKLKRVRGYGLITNFDRPFGVTFNKLDEIAEQLKGGAEWTNL